MESWPWSPVTTSTEILPLVHYVQSLETDATFMDSPLGGRRARPASVTTTPIPGTGDKMCGHRPDRRGRFGRDTVEPVRAEDVAFPFGFATR